MIACTFGSVSSRVISLTLVFIIVNVREYPVQGVVTKLASSRPPSVCPCMYLPQLCVQDVFYNIRVGSGILAVSADDCVGRIYDAGIAAWSEGDIWEIYCSFIGRASSPALSLFSPYLFF